MGTAVVDRLLLILDVVTGKAKKQFDTLSKNLDYLDKNMKKTTKNVNSGIKSIQAGLMGAGLSFLFTGMAIKNFFQGILKNLLQTFLEVEGQSGPVNNAVNELLATFTELKFTLVDSAVATGVFDLWIDRITRLADWFLNLDEDTQAWIFNLMIVLVVIGAIMMVFGQMMLFVLGLIAFFMMIGFAASMVLLVIVLILAIIAIWKSDMSLLGKIFWSIILFLMIIGILLFVFQVSTLVWIAALIAVIAVIVLIIKYWEYVKLALLYVGQAIYNSMLLPLRLVVGVLGKIIGAAEKISGINFGIGDMMVGAATVDFGAKIEDQKKKIADDKAQKEAEVETTDSVDSTSSSGITNIFNVEGSLLSKDTMMEDLGMDLSSISNFGNGSSQN